MQCPPGQVEQNGQCVPEPCPPGEIRNPATGACDCPPGMVRQPNGTCAPYHNGNGNGEFVGVVNGCPPPGHPEATQSNGPVCCTPPRYERGTVEGTCMEIRECFNPDGSVSNVGQSQVDPSLCAGEGQVTSECPPDYPRGTPLSEGGMSCCQEPTFRRVNGSCIQSYDCIQVPGTGAVTGSAHTTAPSDALCDGPAGPPPAACPEGQYKDASGVCVSGPPAPPLGPLPTQAVTTPSVPTGAWPGAPFQTMPPPVAPRAPSPPPPAPVAVPCPTGPIPVAEWTKGCVGHALQQQL